jgi:BirA family biotin operon repressor/biotin-[acetyl-CoA-carboxylase] ligase
MAIDLAFIQSRLAHRQFYWHESIDSTMTEAARLAAEGCPSGTVVGAEEQTAGQGRLGRTWHSPKESGLYFTIVLRLPLAPSHVPVLTLALGLAVADTVRLLGGTQCDLRWPNDLMVDDKKCAGILAQLSADAVLAGIGINVNQTEFPPDVAPVATSLAIATGREQRREPLLVYLLGAIDSFTKMLTTSGIEPILQMFENSSSYVRGRRVVVDQANGPIAGVTAGLTPSGFLQLRKDDGTLVTILAGGVRPAAGW